MKMESQIKIEACGNNISYQNMEMKPHRSKSMHMKMKSPIKIDAYKNDIS